MKEIGEFEDLWSDFIWGVRKDTKMADKSLLKIQKLWNKLR